MPPLILQGLIYLRSRSRKSSPQNPTIPWTSFLPASSKNPPSSHLLQRNRPEKHGSLLCSVRPSNKINRLKLPRHRSWTGLRPLTAHRCRQKMPTKLDLLAFWKCCKPAVTIRHHRIKTNQNQEPLCMPETPKQGLRQSHNRHLRISCLYWEVALHLNIQIHLLANLHPLMIDITTQDHLLNNLPIQDNNLVSTKTKCY